MMWTLTVTKMAKFYQGTPPQMTTMFLWHLFSYRKKSPMMRTRVGMRAEERQGPHPKGNWYAAQTNKIHNSYKAMTNEGSGDDEPGVLQGDYLAVY